MNGINPIANAQYWFISVYIFITLMKTEINSIIKKIFNKKKMSTIMIIIVSYYTLCWINNAAWLGIVRGLVFYFLGAIIRLNEVKFKSHKWLWLWNGILLWISYSVISCLYFIPYSSIIAICILGTLCAFCIVVFAINVDVHPNKQINKIAASVVAVYFVHEHPLLRKFLWSDFFHVETVQYKSNYFIPFCVGTVVVILVFSILLDFLRKQIFNKIQLKSTSNVKND